MQEYITKESLLALGINLEDQDIDSLLSHLNDTVEEQIGTEITESLNDDQLTELVDLQETATDEQLAEWIAAHVPDYQTIVQDNIDIVLGELAENSDGINKAA
jgi:hypothetical protein